MSFSCEGDGREYLERRKNFLLLLFISALLLLSGCDYLSGFKEVEISQTGISKVCDKKHKLKYPEIVPSYITGMLYIKGNEKENLYFNFRSIIIQIMVNIIAPISKNPNHCQPLYIP